MTAPALECRSLRVAYDAAPVLRDVSLAVAADEVVAVLGPSGSGKSTLLAAVAGFVIPAAGEILLDGTIVASPARSVPTEDRRIGVVFQHYALWPHLTALATVAYPLRRAGVPVSDARVRALELLEAMGIAALADRHPAALSGGEQQRVGLARALARDASVFLFDEPTAHLDTALRTALSAELRARRQATGAAALYATHDAGEALAVADHVALLREGRLVQVGSPRQVYEEPVDRWAGGLTGPASVLRADAVPVGDGLLDLALASASVRVRGGGVGAGAQAHVLVRPEWAHLGGPLQGRVRAVSYRGPHTDHLVDTPAGAVVVREAGPPSVGADDPVTWSLGRAWLVPADALDQR